MFDYYKERERLWKKLEKSGAIIGYARHRDTQKYDIHLQNGLIIIANENKITKEMTIDTFLYIWLENRQ